MREILQLSVSQVRLFAPDVLPFDAARVRPNAESIRAAFDFQGAATDENVLVFENGLIKHDSDSSPITKLVIERRKIQLTVADHSQVADAANEALNRILQSIDTRQKPPIYNSLTNAEETSCIAVLDFEFGDLISPNLKAFLDSWVVDRLRTERSSVASIGLRRLSFEVRYEPIDDTLSEYEITFAHKLLTIEPRVGTPWQQRCYFTVSPTDSVTHLALLRELESHLSVQQSRARK